MRVLVTGATGFIGQHLVNRLLAQGHQVSVLTRRPLPPNTFNGPVRSCMGDVTDSLSLLNAIEGQERVYHLAGKIAYKASERSEMEKVNVGGTQKVMDACVTHKTPEVIYMSSVVAIGASFDKTVLDEESPYNIAQLNLGYFETKHKAEQIVKTAFTHNKLNVFILNPSTVYGAGDATKGSRSVQRKVAKGKFPFYTPGGVNVVHIDDVLYCLEQVPLRGRPGERYIVAGENLLLKDVFTMIANAAGVEPPKYRLPKAAIKLLGVVGDVLENFGLKGPLSKETAWTSTLYHWFSSQKAQKELGLNVTPAQTAINESVQWMKTHGYLN
ncbi:MAG: NAD-dependent epimerase/dehydratase family protein [Bdellovibrionales bacterium]|nr:NAD-dependent epimerase/dehydratase family protein [Bdellovibrionales bacterium]